MNVFNYLPNKKETRKKKKKKKNNCKENFKAMKTFQRINSFEGVNE